MEKLEQYKLFMRTHKFDIALFIMRFALAFIFVAHGAIMIMFSNDTIDAFATIGVPGNLGIVIGCIELLTGIMMLTGVIVGVAAATQAFISLCALLFTHGGRGFFIENGGYEYSMLVLAASIAVGLLGPGKIVLARRYAHTTRSLREGGVDAESHPLAT